MRLLDTNWLIQKITLGGEDYISPLIGLPLNGGNSFSENPNDFSFGYCDAYQTPIMYNGDTEFDLPIDSPAILLGFCIVQAEIIFGSSFQEIFYNDLDYNGPFTYEINEMGDEKGLIITNALGNIAYYNNIVLVTPEQQIVTAMYPNPVRNILTLETSNSFEKKITVFTITGKQVMTTLESSSRAILNLSSLSPGIYFIETVNTEGVRDVNKIIKK